jgi:hypothetical protein
MGTDDLTPMLVSPPDAQGMRYGQGKLLAWNPVTFENQVLWQGTVLTNLVVLAGPAAADFQAGQTVALIGWAPGGGAGSWAILGGWITPGTTAAEQSIAFMNTALAKRISQEIFAAQIFTDDMDSGAEFNNTSDYDDPNVGGSPGPTVSDVPISATGRALVFVSCLFQTDVLAAQGAHMSFHVTGATTQDGAQLTEERGIELQCESDPNVVHASMSRPVLVTDLNPGLHTFQAKYRVEQSTPDATVFRRNITVIAF